MGKSFWHYQPGDTACFTFIIVYTLLHSATGIITLFPCTDNTFELLETSKVNRVTCSGIPNDYIVTWSVAFPDQGTVNVGTCSVGSTTCTDFSAIGYMATRPSADTSVMTIEPDFSWIEYIRNGTLQCRATKSGQIDQSESCRLDIISLPSNVTCNVQSVTNASSKTVVGHCDVSKAYSDHGRYICQWYSKQSHAETAVGPPVAMQTTLTNDVSLTNGTYVKGFCDVTMPWPSVDASYTVLISPGNKSYDAGKIDSTSTSSPSDYCLLYLLLLLLLLLLPLPIPLPWPGYPMYVALCRIPNQGSSTGSPQPDNWHPHYICGMKTNAVYFSALFVTNDGRTVLIWSKSSKGRFVWYGTETTPGTNSSGAGHEMDAPPSHSNNVSPESGAVKNGNKHSSQKDKNKHTGTDGSTRKSRHPEAPVELTTVRTSSPPQAATVHGDSQASGTPHGDRQASGTPRLRTLPEPGRMTSVERNSTAETSNMLGRDKHPKLPPIRKPDNHP